MTSGPGLARFRALGTEVVVGATDPVRLPLALAAVRAEVDACDRACSRFREDSELSRLHADGLRQTASAWLCDAVATALDAARRTDGLVDPTIGQTLVDLGYDRTFDEVEPDVPLGVSARHVPAWRLVRIDHQRRRLAVPAGVRLDLGATAKALCADRATARAAAEAGTGTMVSLGGDVAVAGVPPDGGWVIRIADRSQGEPDPAEPVQTVAVSNGGLATSGTTVRRWARAGTALHHVIDPRTSRPAAEAWRTVSVAAPSCVAANTASTAAIILGPDAEAWLAERGHDARLVAPDGHVACVGAWPAHRVSA